LQLALASLVGLSALWPLGRAQAAPPCPRGEVCSPEASGESGTRTAQEAEAQQLETKLEEMEKSVSLLKTSLEQKVAALESSQTQLLQARLEKLESAAREHRDGPVWAFLAVLAAIGGGWMAMSVMQHRITEGEKTARGKVEQEVATIKEREGHAVEKARLEAEKDRTAFVERLLEEQREMSKMLLTTLQDHNASKAGPKP
jgi:hypothetical protein